MQELHNQALELSIDDRWRLVQLLLNSIQKETLVSNPATPNLKALTSLDPWTQSLLGVIQLDAERPTKSYVDYLEEKYS